MQPVDLLIIGGSGFVGSKLVQAAIKIGWRVAYTYRAHSLPLLIPAFQVNLLERESLEACITEARPSKVVYCAVPRGDESMHRAVSVEGVTRLLDTLEKASIPAQLIYVSTNSVFSGWSASNCENDPPDPEKQSEPYRIYAMTRRAGERVTLAGWSNAIVVRTSNVEGRDIHGNLNPRLASLVDALKKGFSVPRFTNRIISPTLVDNFAEAVLEILSADFSYRGILHVAGNQPLSDYDYALCLARHLRIDESLVKTNQAETSSPSKIWNISLDVSFTQSLLKTRLLNVAQQLAVTFPDCHIRLFQV